MLPKFTGISENGELVFYKGQDAYFSNYLRTLEGQKVVVTVTKWSPKRTLPQNAYLHGQVFGIIAKETGNDLETVKDTLKEKFASFIDEKGWKHIEKTSKMDTDRMSKFIEDCCRFAASELNIYIPPPNEG